MMSDSLVLAEHFQESGLFPACKNVSEAVVKVQAGSEMGIGPFSAMRSIHVFTAGGQTQIQIGYQLIASCIKRSGRYNYRVKAHNERGCQIEFQERVGDRWEPCGVSTFTMEDARAQGLDGKSNWRKMPKIMLFARALTQGANMYCPDVFGGAVYAEGDSFGGTRAPLEAQVIDEEPPLLEAPPEPEARRYHVSDKSKPVACENCGAEGLHWGRTHNNKSILLDADGFPHADNCRTAKIDKAARELNDAVKKAEAEDVSSVAVERVKKIEAFLKAEGLWDNRAFLQGWLEQRSSDYRQLKLSFKPRDTNLSADEADDLIEHIQALAKNEVPF